MNAIRRTADLNARELASVTAPTASWHRDYADTAFIYIGGLDPRLSEGDILTIFSQHGEPVWIKLARDRETGKSRGFAWLKYEDQRSCDLAVDNLSGAGVLGRVLNVDHTRYEPRKGKDGMVEEDMRDNTVPVGDRDANGLVKIPGVESDEDEDGEGSAGEGVAKRPLLKEERELLEIMSTYEEDDPMKGYMIQQKREEIETAKKALVSVEKKHNNKNKDEDSRNGKPKSKSRAREHTSRRRGDKSRHGQRSRSPRNGREDQTRDLSRDGHKQKRDGRERSDKDARKDEDTSSRPRAEKSPRRRRRDSSSEPESRRDRTRDRSR